MVVVGWLVGWLIDWLVGWLLLLLLLLLNNTMFITKQTNNTNNKIRFTILYSLHVVTFVATFEDKKWHDFQFPLRYGIISKTLWCLLLLLTIYKTIDILNAMCCVLTYEYFLVITCCIHTGTLLKYLLDGWPCNIPLYNTRDGEWLLRWCSSSSILFK